MSLRGRSSFRLSRNIQSTVLNKTDNFVPELQAKLKIGMTYMKPYLVMKSQETMLLSIEHLIPCGDPDVTEGDEKVAGVLIDQIHDLTSANIGSLFITANDIVNEIASLLHEVDISENILRPAKLLIQACASIMRIANLFGVQKMEDSCTVQESPRRSMNHDHSDLLVCRICNEMVPSVLFDQHTTFCIDAYKSETKVIDINNRISEMISIIKDKFLCVPWPGQQEEMVGYVLPMLHISIILNHALGTDPTTYEALENLKLIKQTLDLIEASEDAAPFIRQATSLVSEKASVSMALRLATDGLADTRVSGNSKPATIIIPSIADFEFVSRISAGAFGSVFVAKKKNTGDIYAIKAIPKPTLKQKNHIKRILAEKNIMAMTQSPYIVTFYYSIIGQRNLYMVTEFVPAGDLYSLLQNVGCFDEDTARVYFVEIAEALRYLRENGIIHRDIKPDNILINADGRLKLTDFGLSLSGFVDRQQDDCNEVVGTLDYMAPEIILSQSHTYAVDYWSLGTMLFEFLVGIPPFHGEDEADTQMRILTRSFCFEEEDGVSEEAQDLIERLIDPNPATRLGADSIDDILNHKWVKGIKANTTEPPFKPQLGGDVDTGYFEQRYNFSTVSDKDIIDDIADSTPTSLGKLGENESELNSFQSASVDSLVHANKRIVRSSSLNPMASEPCFETLLFDIASNSESSPIV